MNPSLAAPARPADADFDALLANHRGIVVKVATSYCSDRDDRADLMQDIVLQLWQAWPGYDRTRPFATWMYRIALNVAISQQRRRPAALLHEPLDAHDALVGADDVDAEARERARLVQRALHALGDVDRALLLLHLDGCSQRETADIVGSSEGAVATRLSRIRQHLRRVVDAASTEGDPR